MAGNNQATPAASLMLNPPGHSTLIELASAFITARAIHVLCELRIADHLSSGPRSAAALASATGADERSLRRLLGAAAAHQMVVERDGMYAQGPLGGALETGSPEAAAVQLVGNDAMWNAVRDLRETTRTGAPALAKHRPHPQYREAPGTAHAALLASSMRAFHRGEPEAVAAASDLSGRALAVDVGGSTGSVLAALLKANPGLQGVIYDLPHYAAHAQQLISARGLDGRCRFEAGSFFEAVPRGADVYVLSHVLHDWPDAEALTILKNCREAIGPAGRLLIIEMIQGEGEPDAWAQLYDLILLVSTEGRLRDTSEHSALLRRAAFQLDRVCPTRCSVSIIEASPA